MTMPISNPSRQIPYGRQDITDEDIEAVTQALRADFLTQGPTISEFEEAFAGYVGAKFAVAVANGTAALHLGALALGVGKGSRVITTPITFAASANCIAYCGGSVQFADVDPSTALIDISKVKEILASEPKGTFEGIIPVDFAGAPVDLEALRTVAEEHGLWILEDACHAPGGYFVDSQGGQQKCGGSPFADLSIFSFHPVKHIACGEGGMITTDREDLYKNLMTLRTHGITKDPTQLRSNHGGWYYEMQQLGFNYRLTDIQAALGLSQLARADKNLERRRRIAAYYDRAFENTKVQPLGPSNREGHAFHLYVIRTPRRKELYDHLRTQGIYAQVHYVPVHKMPYYQANGHDGDSFPQAEAYYNECLSLPMFPTLRDDELQFVVKSVNSFFS